MATTEEGSWKTIGQERPKPVPKTETETKTVTETEAKTVTEPEPEAKTVTVTEAKTVTVTEPEAEAEKSSDDMLLTKYLLENFGMNLNADVLDVFKEIELKTVGDFSYIDEDDFARVTAMMKKIPAAKFVQAWKVLHEQEEPQQSVQAPKQGSYANAASSPPAAPPADRPAAPPADRRAADRRAAPPANKWYKMAICRSWEENSICSYGDNCNFAHGEKDLRRGSHYKTRFCNNWKTNGACSYGVNCNFAHTEAELRTANPGIPEQETTYGIPGMPPVDTPNAPEGNGQPEHDN